MTIAGADTKQQAEGPFIAPRRLQMVRDRQWCSQGPGQNNVKGRSTITIVRRKMSRRSKPRTQLEDELQYKAAHTADYNEGINAFLEKRSPIFKGE